MLMRSTLSMPPVLQDVKHLLTETAPEGLGVRELRAEAAALLDRQG